MTLDTLSPVEDDTLLLEMGQFTFAGEEFLAHDGVKGMRWGHRKAPELAGPRPSAAPVDHKARNRRVAKVAVAVGAVAVAAIMLKRGRIPMTSPLGNKIALSGAKSSFKIVQKTSTLMATTSVKVGRVAVKGGVGTAKVTGKVGAKAGIAIGKGAGRVAADRGYQVYDRVLRPSGQFSVKYGSHAMYKLTGRGTPIVREVTRGYGLNPVDLLLNTRSDYAFFRGR